MLLYLSYLIIGIAGILGSAYLAVIGCQKIAKIFHLHDAFVGLTVLSIGTSFPEIATHIAASLRILEGADGVASGVAVGTNIGSNIIQITLITGVIAVLTAVKAKDSHINRDYLMMLFSILLLWSFTLGGYINRVEGFILMFGYILYLWHLGRTEHVFDKVNHQKHIFHRITTNTVYVVLGLSGLWYFANLVLDNALILSDIWGVSGSLIGALIIGVGTALPEFTTAVVAILRGSSGMSLGTLIGSNITNPMFAIGVGALISGYSVGKEIIYFDLPFWFFISLLGYFLFKNKMRLEKWHGFVLAGSYMVYVVARLAIS